MSEHRNLVHISNTLRAYFDLDTHHSVDTATLQWLRQHDFAQVIVLLIDGMGSDQIRRLAKEDGFLKRHHQRTISTVFPPTTVAATTAFLSGKYPCEIAWLGWQQYFPEIKEHLVMFLNRCYYTRLLYSDVTYSQHALPFQNLLQECKEHGISANEIYPAFRKDGVSSFKAMCQRIVMESKTQKHRCIYAYWDEFDSIQHTYGTASMQAKQTLRIYEDLLEECACALSEDTGLIVLADHGQVDVKCHYLIDYPELLECMYHLPSIEARTISFYLKKDKMAVFQERFQHCFPNEFQLYTKRHVLENKLFGQGTPHPRFQDFLGEYLAVAIGHTELVYDASYAVKGSHAGMTKEEMEIPLILYTNASSDE